jgi:hypothetical protein
MCKFAILYGEKLREYDLGHVLIQDRYENFVELFEGGVHSTRSLFLIQNLPYFLRTAPLQYLRGLTINTETT